MAVPSRFQQGLLPAEIEFLAENQLIKIQPSQRMDRLKLISGNYGPFKPPLSKQVPLWLALTLKKKGKCKVQPPEWLNCDFLQEKLDEERRNPNGFSELPFHWLETIQLLLDHARDDMRHADQLQSLVKDLQDSRQAKIRVGLKKSLDGVALDATNLGCMEVNELKPYFVKVFDELSKLDPESEYLHDSSKQY